MRHLVRSSSSPALFEPTRSIRRVHSVDSHFPCPIPSSRNFLTVPSGRQHQHQPNTRREPMASHHNQPALGPNSNGFCNFPCDTRDGDCDASVANPDISSPHVQPSPVESFTSPNPTNRRSSHVRSGSLDSLQHYRVRTSNRMERAQNESFPATASTDHRPLKESKTDEHHSSSGRDSRTGSFHMVSARRRIPFSFARRARAVAPSCRRSSRSALFPVQRISMGHTEEAAMEQFSRMNQPSQTAYANNVAPSVNSASDPCIMSDLTQSADLLLHDPCQGLQGHSLQSHIPSPLGSSASAHAKKDILATVNIVGADNTSAQRGGSESMRDPHLQLRRRRYQLKFLELNDSGDIRERSLTRHELLHEISGLEIGQNGVMSHVHRKKKKTGRGKVHPNSESKQHLMEPVRDLPRERHGRSNRGKPIRTIPDVMFKTISSVGKVSGNRSSFNLTLRDIRQVDPAFTAKPTLWVRHSCILVSLEMIRAMIMHDRMFLFDPENESVKQPIHHIRQRLMFGTRNSEEAFMPFEFRALEGILIYSCTSVERDFNVIERSLINVLEALPMRSDSLHLERLRLEEQSLNYCFGRMRKLQNVLQSVLDTDEDMANMYLTEKSKTPTVRRNPLDHEEVEMLLESYLQVVDDLNSRAALLNQAIDDAENLMEIHLGTKQIQLLKVTVKITLISTLIAFATAIFGIFGMNLPLTYDMKNLPSSQYYFYATASGTTLVVLVGAVLVTKWIHRAGQGLYAKRRGRRALFWKQSAIESTWMKGHFHKSPGSEIMQH